MYGRQFYTGVELKEERKLSYVSSKGKVREVCVRADRSERTSKRKGPATGDWNIRAGGSEPGRGGERIKTLLFPLV